LDRLIIEDGNEQKEIAVKVFNDSSKLKPLQNQDAWKIFQRLHEKASYPAELAKELGMNEQKVYYSIKQLKNYGLIKVEKTQEIQGAVAKYYSAAYDSFALVPTMKNYKGSKVLAKSKIKNEASEFLVEFTKKDFFSGKIVVGSPDPHGKYRARARDGHLAAELSAFISANTSGFELPLVFLDTMVGDLKNENSNLIIIGGPLTNKLAEQLNEFSPLRFVPAGGNWIINSKASGIDYNEDTTGIIVKMPHPYFKGKWILMVAGKRNTGTIAGIQALAKYTSKAVKPNVYDKKSYAHVVEGLDLDGDGLIDEVEFKE